jgi:two-component system nitrate/nitrite response regulator NarL
VALRCLIVDYNARFLEAARDVLEREGITVVGSASTSAEALRLAQELHPEVVLVDVSLGAENGFDLARDLTVGRDGDAPAVILVSTYAETDFSDLVAASPAVGFLSKSDLSGRRITKMLGRNSNGDSVRM